MAILGKLNRAICPFLAKEAVEGIYDLLTAFSNLSHNCVASR